jgi:hypothetical protein
MVDLFPHGRTSLPPEILDLMSAYYTLTPAQRSPIRAITKSQAGLSGGYKRQSSPAFDERARA